MKVKESGMPQEKMWEQFFDINNILDDLEINKEIETLVDFGCGYGTFSIPAGIKINGNVFAYDIEESLIEEIESKLKVHNIENVFPFKYDFISEETDLQNESVDYVMLFNILHAEKSFEILEETYRILKKNGKVGIIHWIYDSATPRGPSMSIRPKPEDLKNLLIKSGFSILKYNLKFPPYHYGILAQK